MFFLLALAFMIGAYFCMMLSMAGEKANQWHKLWCEACIFANVIILAMGILKNPGIPQRHIDRLLKE